jgi:hypothetical protein
MVMLQVVLAVLAAAPGRRGIQVMVAPVETGKRELHSRRRGQAGQVAVLAAAGAATAQRTLHRLDQAAGLGYLVLVQAELAAQREQAEPQPGMGQEVLAVRPEKALVAPKMI